MAFQKKEIELKIKSITVTNSKEMGGYAKSVNVDIDLFDEDDQPRGVEAIQMLHDAIGMILDEIV